MVDYNGGGEYYCHLYLFNCLESRFVQLTIEEEKQHQQRLQELVLQRVITLQAGL